MTPAERKRKIEEVKRRAWYQNDEDSKFLLSEIDRRDEEIKKLRSGYIVDEHGNEYLQVCILKETINELKAALRFYAGHSKSEAKRIITMDGGKKAREALGENSFMSKAMKIDLKDLLTKARAATPGPWFYGNWAGQCYKNHGHDGSSCTYEYEKRDYGHNICAPDGNTIVITTAEYGELDKQNGEFIAAANPEVVLELCERLQEAVEVLKLGIKECCRVGMDSGEYNFVSEAGKFLEKWDVK